MEGLVFALTAVFFGWLILENYLAKKHRRGISHVIYVNGTRGKSSVTRLIDAGLRAGGLRCFCKTTGTLPMTIDTAGEERVLRRRGCANIREQLDILHRAAKEKADVLVLECMAVDPVLQAVSQHRMVRADIGVITNVRLDHTDVMGETLAEIAQALSNTIPREGILFTAEETCFSALQANAKALGSSAVLVRPEQDGKTYLPGGENTLPDFPENVCLALQVCAHLGVSREKALVGMGDFHKDPYALSVYKLPGEGLFINGMSINDPQSTAMVYRSMAEKAGFGEKRVILLMNSRRDRAERTAQLAALALELSPAEIWLIGPGSGLLEKKLKTQPWENPPPLRRFRKAQDTPLSNLGPGEILFAAGNIAGPGRMLMDRVKQEGKAYVL